MKTEKEFPNVIASTSPISFLKKLNPVLQMSSKTDKFFPIKKILAKIWYWGNTEVKYPHAYHRVLRIELQTSVWLERKQKTHTQMETVSLTLLGKEKPRWFWTWVRLSMVKHVHGTQVMLGHAISLPIKWETVI